MKNQAHSTEHLGYLRRGNDIFERVRFRLDKVILVPRSSPIALGNKKGREGFRLFELNCWVPEKPMEK